MTLTRWIKLAGWAVTEAPASPRFRREWYPEQGYVAVPPELAHLPASRLGIADGAVIELPEPAPTPRVFSKLKLRDNLVALGLWDMLKAAISADADVSERWALAQDVREDDADFVALCVALSPQLPGGKSLDDVLDMCIKEA